MLQVGSITGVTFQGIKAVSESGILVVASPDNVIEGLTIRDMDLQLVSMAKELGGFHDLRPGIYGIVHNVTDDAVYLEHANNVTLSDLRVWHSCPHNGAGLAEMQIHARPMGRYSCSQATSFCHVCQCQLHHHGGGCGDIMHVHCRKLLSPATMMHILVCARENGDAPCR